VPNHGATKVYHGLDFESHYGLSTHLLGVRAHLLAARELIVAGYGKSDGKAKLVQRLVEEVDRLRAHLSHDLLSECSEQPTAILSKTYYPPERKG
jgi:hypothetical protein